MILMTLLVIGSLQIMAINYIRRMDDFESSRETHREDLEKMSSMAQFVSFGIADDPRPPLLGIFAVGLDQKMSSSYSVPGYNIFGGGNTESPIQYQQHSEMEGMEMEGSKYSNPIFSLFQPPDFVYVVNIVLSLLAILFAYDCICGEKEDQTLKLMLTNSVPRDVVLLGKWIGGTLSIVMPFILAFIVGVALLSTNSQLQFTDEAWKRIAMILFTSTLYVMVFFLVGMAVSTFTERATTSLIVSLFVWVFLVLVVPNIAPVIARQIKPITTPTQVSAEEESGNREMVDEYKTSLDKATRGENADTKGVQEKLRKEMKESMASMVKTKETEWFNRLENQTRLAMNISRLSPSANFIYAASNIAGTGVDEFFNFRQQVPQFKKDLQKLTEKDTKELFDKDPAKPFPPNMFIKIKTQNIPYLEITTLNFEKSVKAAAMDLGLLAAWLIALFMASFIGFLRYDVK